MSNTTEEVVMPDLVKMAGQMTSNPGLLVNEKEPTDSEEVVMPDLVNMAYEGTRALDGVKSKGQIAAEQAEETRRAKLPKGWLGEGASGFARGTDQVQQLLYGGGAIASSLVGWDSARDYFRKGMDEQDKQMEENPTDYGTYDKIDGFDGFMRYAMSSVGELGPQILQSIGSGIVGGIAGGPAAGGAGAVAAFIERQAIADIVKAGAKTVLGKAVKEEIKDFALGKIERTALTETAKAVIKEGASNIAKKYGANAAVGINSWVAEAGSIYSDSRHDPKVNEKDRLLSSIIGGFAAAVPEFGMESYLVSKFFEGKNPGKEAIKDASSYVVRFLKEYGKEIAKVVPMEAGQEYVQTVIEEASKNWADPSKRTKIFEFNEEQKKSFIDAAFKGGLGGFATGGIGGVSGAAKYARETAVPKSTDPAVRAKEEKMAADIDAKAGPVITNEIDEKDQRVSAIAERKAQIDKELEDPAITEEDKAKKIAEITSLDDEMDKLLGNENEEEEVEKKETKQEKLEKRDAELKAMVGKEVPHPESATGKAKVVSTENGQLSVYYKDKDGNHKVETVDPPQAAAPAATTTSTAPENTTPSITPSDWISAWKGQQIEQEDASGNKVKKNRINYVHTSNAKEGEQIVHVLNGKTGVIDKITTESNGDRTISIKYDDGTTDASRVLPGKDVYLGGIARKSELASYLPAPSAKATAATTPAATTTTAAATVTESPDNLNDLVGSMVPHAASPTGTAEVMGVVGDKIRVNYKDSDGNVKLELVEPPARPTPPGQSAAAKPQAGATKSNVVTPIQRAKGLLQTFFLKETPNRDVTARAPLATKEQQQAKFDEISALIDEIAKTDKEYAYRLAECFGPDVINFLASEGINVRQVTEQDTKNHSVTGFSVIDEAGGQITITVPTADTFNNQAISMDELMPLSKRTEDMSKRDYRDFIGYVMNHEFIHAADLVGLREEHAASGSEESFSQYEERIMKERGKAFTKAYPNLPWEIRAVYAPLARRSNRLTDRSVGQEFPRMIVEFSRTGKLSEVTDAIFRASREEATDKGPVSEFLKHWMDAIENLFSQITKLFDPENADADVMKVVKSINKVMDKYGLLVNEKTAKQQAAIKPETKAAVKTKGKAKKTPEAKVQNAPEAPKEKKTKGPKIPAEPKLFKPKAKKASKQEEVKKEGAQALRDERPRERVSNGGESLSSSEERGGEDDFDESESTASEGYSDDQIDVTGGATRVGKGVLAAIKTARGDLKTRVDWTRDILADNLPYMSDMFSRLAKTVNADASDPVKLANFKRAIESIIPVKGQKVADRLNELKKFNIFTGKTENPPSNPELHDFLYEHSMGGIRADMQEVRDSGLPVVDLTGNLITERGVNVVEDASVNAPYNITDKLIEAKLAKHVEETYSLEELGVKTINPASVEVFNSVFGEDNWIAKSFNVNALRSNDVFPALYLKDVFKDKPDVFAGSDTSRMMIQKLMDLPDDVREVYKTTSTIVFGNELRVHVITDPNTGEAHVVPFATFRKADWGTPEIEDKFPILFHDSGTLDAERVALESIQSLPLLDRLGAMYGLDILKTKTGWGVAELNPTTPAYFAEDGKGAASGYLITNPYAIDAVMSAMRGQAPYVAAIAEALVNPLVNESGKSGAEGGRPGTGGMIAEELGIRFDGERKNGEQWQFTDTDVASPAHGTAFYTPIESSSEEVEQVLEERRDMFAAAPAMTEDDLDAFTESIKTGAEMSRPKFTKDDQTMITEVERRVNNDISAGFLKSEEKQAEERIVQGGVVYDKHSTQEMYYLTRPHTQSARKAQEVVNTMGGAFKTGEALLVDPTGESMGIKDDSTIDELAVPNATLRATYENVLMQLTSMHENLVSGGANPNTIFYVSDMFYTLGRRMMTIGNAGGSFNAYVGQAQVIYNGNTAVREAIDNMLKNADSVVGGKAKEKFTDLVSELNGLWHRYSGAVVNSPRIVGLLRRIHKMFNESKFTDGVRQTMANDIKKLKEIVKKSAARAAEAIATSDKSSAYLNRAIENIIKDMTGVPHGTQKKSTIEIFRDVVSGVTRSTAKEMGMILPNPKTDRLAMEKQLSVILKNPELYAQFATSLHNAYVKEYGGPAPSQEFLEEAAIFHDNLMKRMWNDDMLKSLVNEKMGELQLKIAEIVKENVKHGKMAVKSVKDSIRKIMQDEGVDDDALIEQLVADIEEHMNERIDRARARFLTSKGNIRSFLNKMGTTLAEAAKAHARYSDQMLGSFEDMLVSIYDLPNEDDMPIARTMALAMQQEFNKMVEAERNKIIERWLKNVKSNKSVKKESGPKLDAAVQRMLEMANMGMLKSVSVYNALAEKFNLPKYDPKLIKEIERLGDIIGNSNFDRQKNITKQELADLMARQKGFKTSDAYTSWMYLSMLSGISTQMVNIGGNFTNLIGYIIIESIKHPSRFPKMLSALIRAATGVAALEATESFWTGLSLGKTGNKYFMRSNPIDTPDARFKSEYSTPALAAADQALAEFTHKLMRGVKGQYVGRALMATDIYFYKIAQEMAYTSRVGETGTPGMWDSAMLLARREMEKAGQDPDSSKDMRRRQKILAHSIYAEQRLTDGAGNLVNERVTAWEDANSEALDATFQQEPKYFLGFLCKHIERFTKDVPIARLIIPFTKVAANVTNAMLEWTPVGFARYAFEQKGNPFKLMEKGEWKKESDIALRAALGTAAMIVLMSMCKDEDEEDPYFTIYGDGPRDLNARRQLQQMGWKPNTVKVGGAYFSYLYTPLAMALSIVGRHLDDYRDGKIASPHSLSMATSAVALLEAVKNQSFLASVADLMSAVDSPDPQSRLSKVFSRISSIPIPNLLKQTDKYLDPSLQQANGFWQSFIKELPIARHTLKPAINVFGEEVDRTPGYARIPGADRFITERIETDPVFNFLGQKRIVVPGFSKGTRLNDIPMTEEQYYSYVKEAGPRIKQRIQAELGHLKNMTKENAQERVDNIAAQEKANIRSRMKEEARKTQSQRVL